MSNRRFSIERRRGAIHLVGWMGTVALILVATGCRPKSADPRVLPLEGKIEKIELFSDTTGKLTIMYYSEKHGQDMVGVGEVTERTEIMINGVIATLKDLREGDRVRGEARVEKKGNKRVQTALKIHVDRAKPIGNG